MARRTWRTGSPSKPRRKRGRLGKSLNPSSPRGGPENSAAPGDDHPPCQSAAGHSIPTPPSVPIGNGVPTRQDRRPRHNRLAPARPAQPAPWTFRVGRDSQTFAPTKGPRHEHREDPHTGRDHHTAAFTPSGPRRAARPGGRRNRGAGRQAEVHLRGCCPGKIIRSGARRGGSRIRAPSARAAFRLPSAGWRPNARPC